MREKPTCLICILANNRRRELEGLSFVWCARETPICTACSITGRQGDGNVRHNPTLLKRNSAELIIKRVLPPFHRILLERRRLHRGAELLHDGGGVGVGGRRRLPEVVQWSDVREFVHGV